MRATLHRLGLMILILVLAGGLAVTAVQAHGTTWQGVNVTGRSPVCSTIVENTAVSWVGNKVLSFNNDDLQTRSIDPKDLGDKWMATLDLPACNIGFTPDFTSNDGCTTAPIAVHAATAGMNPRGPAAIKAMNSTQYRYFAGYDTHGNLGTILFRIPCPGS